MGAMVAFSFACSFAVDYGRMRLAKSQLHNAADAAALAAANAMPHGLAAARAEAVKFAKANITDGVETPVDANQDVTFGYWGDPQDLIDGPDEDVDNFDDPNDDVDEPDVPSVFTPLAAGDGRANAIRVSLERSKARGNPIQLIFSAMVGAKTCDVHAHAIAVAYNAWPGDGFAGIKKIKMEKKSTTDSYLSTWGPYSESQRREHGSIKTNGKLKFKKDVVIYGDAHPGVKSKRDAQGGTVTGSRARLTYMLSYPPVELLPKKHPKPKPKHSGDFELKKGATATLAAGEYRFHKFKIDKNATLTLSGEVTLYIEDEFKVDGTLITYLNKPGNLHVRVIGKKQVKIGKDRSVYADIYAPLAKAKIEKNSQLFGALIAREFKVSDRADLHYDESLNERQVGAALVE
jgi:hypothetical protein